MIKLKTKAEIEIMRQGGKILAEILAAVMKEVRPGISTARLNDLAEKLIAERGAKPSFKNYRVAWAERAYPAALCVSVNNEVVHGIPDSERILAEGDIVGLDCGLEYRGLFTDIAKTVPVGRIGGQAGKLITVAEKALNQGLKQARPSRRLFDIARAIQQTAEADGFSVVRQLVGHGVGYQAHEDPQVPNYLGPGFRDIELKPGLTLAIEPMINAGAWDVETLDDGWTIVTADNSLSAHFEHTIAITEKGCEILTKK